MKQLNWYQIFGNAHKIPDGRTVLPTDDIQILLNCANIWDKAYTTIAQLLADTTSLMTVISDNNAVDYLVRSTTFASSVTADSSAMTYIGLNNYASNTLLADSTWCNAICNSAYFESVLNVKVPTMTSATTPEGEVVSNGTDPDNPNWKAFDGNNSTIGTGRLSASPSGGAYLGYHFTSPIAVTRVLDRTASGAVDTGRIEYSDDGVTWTPASESYTATASDGEKSFNLGLHGSHAYWRKYLISASGYSRLSIYELQFYGREDV